LNKFAQGYTKLFIFLKQSKPMSFQCYFCIYCWNKLYCICWN